MHALPEGARLDLQAFEVLEYWAARTIGESDGVEPVGGCSVVGLGHRHDIVAVPEEVVVPAGDFMFFGKEIGELFQLGDANGGENVDEPIVVADLIVNEFDRVSFGSGGEMLCPGRKVGVIGGYHSTAAGGDELVPVKTEGGHISD